MTSALRFEGFSVRRDDATVVAIDDIALDSGRGGVVSGPSGSGKTTLLRAIAGGLDASAVASGRLVLRGDVGEVFGRRPAGARRRSVSP